MFSLSTYMQILKKSRKTGLVKLKPEHLDDLWELSHLIQEGDLITARTERKIDVGNQRANQIRKTLTLEGAVTQATLEHEVLRVQTTITQGPDDLVSHGDHHSFSITAHTEFSLQKTWDSVQWDRLEQAAQRNPLNVLLVTFDREEAWFAELTRRGYETLTNISGDVAKKAPGGGEENFWKTIAELITDLDTRNDYENIIAASPAFWTDYLIKALPEKTQKKTTTATCSAVGEAALAEVVKRPELQRVLQADQTTKEESIIADILEAISKDNGCYGIDECEQKSAIGQVKKLAISHNLIKQAREEDWYGRLDELIQQAKSTQADVNFIEHVTEQLDSIGGIAGVQRW